MLKPEVVSTSKLVLNGIVLFISLIEEFVHNSLNWREVSKISNLDMSHAMMLL